MHSSASRLDPTLSAIGIPEPQGSAVRVWLASTTALALLVLIGWIFWREDWRYSQPTPRPVNLVQPALGASLGTRPELVRIVGATPDRPTWIHVFNPSCPCSRFNVDHVRELVHRYGERVRFVALLQTEEPDLARQSFDAFGIDAPAFVDDDGQIASLLGVYSTPQAVILRTDGTLYYRGNYNRTRYCNDARTEFARLALDALLAGEPLPPFPDEATTAYGCPLPDSIEER